MTEKQKPDPENLIDGRADVCFTKGQGREFLG